MTRTFVLLSALALAGCSRPDVVVGSKSDNETTLLAGMAAAVLRDGGVSVGVKPKLGGTPVAWQALVNGDIDVYPEYTGTVAEQILKTRDGLPAALAKHGVGMSKPLGFANNYAVGMKADRAAALGLKRVSDLGGRPGLVFGFSSEFMARADGWPALRDRYRLPQTDVRGMDHQLAYAALAAGQIDATDLYTTDAEIARYDLVALDDDERFFPAYEAVFLYRLDKADRVAALAKLAGRLTEADMIRLNGEAQAGTPEAELAAGFLKERLGIAASAGHESPAAYVGRLTLEHLRLVAVSLTAAVLVAVPLGVVAAYRPRLGQAVLAVTGVVQTIPSLALLVFMIPLLGIGEWPAVTALFLYSLLPIVRNTYTGLHDIPPNLRESARALGLGFWARLRLVELPLASRSILAGVKTAAVINVGTATLGAFIGAGGLGQAIQTGVQLNDTRIILQGAVPAAALALAVQGLFEVAERRLVPRGLRL